MYTYLWITTGVQWTSHKWLRIQTYSSLEWAGSGRGGGGVVKVDLFMPGDFLNNKLGGRYPASQAIFRCHPLRIDGNAV